MGVSVTVASYSTTIAIVFAGVTPFIYSPLSNIYGRRPVYIISTVIGIVASAGCAVCTNWATLLVARAFVGIGSSVGRYISPLLYSLLNNNAVSGMGIGASVVADIYFAHQRGTYMGIYVVLWVTLSLNPSAGL